MKNYCITFSRMDLSLCNDPLNISCYLKFFIMWACHPEKDRHPVLLDPVVC